MKARSAMGKCSAWVLAVTLGCAQFGASTAPFSPKFVSDPETLKRALTRGRASLPPDEIALMVEPSRDGLRGVLLGSGVTWMARHRVDAFAITHDSALILGDEELVSVALNNGSTRFRRRVGPLIMVGAAGEGELTAVVLRTADSRRTNLLALDHRGSVMQQWETEEQLGNPAVFGPYVWVPWRAHSVSALDPVSGAEITRITRAEPVRDAYANESGLWFGAQSFELLGAPNVQRAASLRGLAGVPDMPLIDAKPRALEEVRLPFLYAALPKPNETWATLGNTHYLTLPRTLVALRSSDLAVRWVQNVGADVLDAAPVEGGLVICARDGSVERVNDRGEHTSIVARGAPISQCLLHANKPMASSGAPEPSLTGFLQVLATDDPALAPLQSQLLQVLGARADEEATSMLLRVAERYLPCQEASLREQIAKARGCTALEGFLARASFEARTPLGSIALAASGCTSVLGSGRLGELLLSPDTPESELPLLATAAGRSEGHAAALRHFFILNRVGNKSKQLEQALIEVARAMLRLRSMSDYILLRRAASDTETSATLRTFLTTELASAPPSADASGIGKAP